MNEIKTKRQEPTSTGLESPFSSCISVFPAPLYYSPCVFPALSKDSEDAFKEVDNDCMSDSFFAESFDPLLNGHVLSSFSKSWDENFAESYEHFSHENNARSFKPHLTPVQVSKEEVHVSCAPHKILPLDSSSGKMRKEPSDSNQAGVNPSLIDFKKYWFETIPLGDRIIFSEERTAVSCIQI